MKENKKLSKDNFPLYLRNFLKENSLTIDKVAKAIDCPRGSLDRILIEQTKASTKMLKQGGIMFEIGFKEYKKLNSSQKEKISESIGSVGGGVLGFGAISSAVSAAGVTGLAGGAAITSGLAGLGAIVGGGMVAGVAVAAAIPLAGVAAGYGMTKGIKTLVRNHKLSKTEIDPTWEEVI